MALKILHAAIAKNVVNVDNKHGKPMLALIL
jgi:hypothetical protein